MADGTTSRATRTLASTLPSVDTVEGTALEWAAKAGFDQDTAGNVGMVIREAAVNAIIHGNQYDPKKRVQVTFELTSEAFTVTIADQGPGIDVDSIPDPLAAENLLRSSGRGIFLMRAFMDEVHFRQLSPGTEITLTKHRTTR